MRQLVILVKEPHPGRVKTRLGRDIGMTTAAWWFRHQCARLFRAVSDPRWVTVLAVTPDREGVQSRVWPAHLPRWPQGRGNLGDRMARLFRSLPPGPVLIIGADVPGVTRTHIARAFRALPANGAVLGPSPDGGYWLIGLARSPRRVPPGLFAGVRWSGPHAMADTIRSFGTFQIGYADTLADVDTACDLANLSLPPPIADI